MKLSDDYFAGIFDGEGCFSINHSFRKGYSQRVFQPIGPKEKDRVRADR